MTDPTVAPLTAVDRALVLRWLAVLGPDIPVRAALVRQLLGIPEPSASPALHLIPPGASTGFRRLGE